MSLSRATDHKAGRMLAYKLMCLMTVRRHDKDLSSEHLTHFYRLLHVGLTGSDQVCATINLAFPKNTFFNAFCIVVDNRLIASSGKFLKHGRDTYPSLEALIGSGYIY